MIPTRVMSRLLSKILKALQVFSTIVTGFVAAVEGFRASSKPSSFAEAFSLSDAKQSISLRFIVLLLNTGIPFLVWVSPFTAILC